MTKQHKIKTNAMRLLDAHHIAYATFTYPDTIHSADEAAALLGIPAHHMFKTLVVFADKGRRLLIMVPGDHELELRKAAQAVKAKSVEMASQREAEHLTGLKVGGISPLALLDKHFEIYLDISAVKLDAFYLSGGQRGVTIRLRVADLLALTEAKVISATSSVEIDPVNSTSE